MSPQVRIANPISGPGWTSAKRAAKLVAKGRAYMVAGVLWIRPTETARASAPARSVRPMQRARLMVTSHSGSGVGDGRGFARYPLPLQTSTGPRFPGLARAGAGL